MNFIWVAAGTSDEFGRQYLADYASYCEIGVEQKIMRRARDEGFRGTLQERLEYLGWEIVKLRVEEVR